MYSNLVQIVGIRCGAHNDWCSYDAATFKTTLTADTTSWLNDDLVGRYVQPNIEKVSWNIIISNTANSIVVWGACERMRMVLIWPTPEMLSPYTTFI
ncbi:MAG: hypothetical protein JXR76_27705 [Deltaproteobacteria bacterium]|nr:hypothetical protein [Deltaproteobacteria bacterium]